MKRYLPIILLLLIALVLPSCVGIGDGALFDNITTGEKKENSVTVPEADAFCQIYPGMSPGGTVTTQSMDAMTLYLNLSLGNYSTDVDRTAEEKPYFELLYSSTTDKHYIIYEDDFVIEKVKKINLDLNTVDNFILLGQLPGVYEQIEAVYVDTLNEVTDAEREAGCKLNCLQVKMKPEVSRVFYLSDFEDIGGFYFVTLPNLSASISGDYNTVSSGDVMVYFKSCTPEELEEKIALLKKNTVVKSASQLFVINTQHD